MKILRPEEVTDITKLKWNGTPEEHQEAMRLAKDAFTADDLQKFTEIEEGISVEELFAELEKQRQEFEEGKHR